MHSVSLYERARCSMSNSILCVIDFSNSSRKALEWAVMSATSNQSHLTILFPYRLTRLPFGESAVAMKRKIEEEANKNFGVLETEFLKGSKVSYDFKTEVGFLSDRVEEHAKRNPLSFVVIDKNVRSINRESFDDLVEHANVPVVIVP